jgi:FG-GAP repeat
MSRAKLLILSPILLLSVTRAWCAGEPHPGQDARSPLPNARRSNISAALVPISQLAELTASDGTAVAIGGDTVVVGALNETINGNTYQGAAYVFFRPANGWATSPPPSAVLTGTDET